MPYAAAIDGGTLFTVEDHANPAQKLKHVLLPETKAVLRKAHSIRLADPELGSKEPYSLSAYGRNDIP
jgi:hypothetical protein